MHLMRLFFYAKVLSISLLLCCCANCKLIPERQTYTIGGWIPGPESDFLSKWEPILGKYLSSTVGALYDPPIKFELIPADYQVESSFDALIEAGAIDFACKRPPSHCI
jgi:hypothetical protein